LWGTLTNNLDGPDENKFSLEYADPESDSQEKNLYISVALIRLSRLARPFRMELTRESTVVGQEIFTLP
jgi:hypothetical protein